MKKHKKVIIIAISGFIIIALFSAIGMLCLGHQKSTDSKTKTNTVTKYTAEVIKSQATQAVETKDYDNAIKLLQETKDQYTELKDNDNVTEAEIQKKTMEYEKNLTNKTAANETTAEVEQ